VAIAFTSVVFALTTDSTRLADALVEQGHVPERFAYGALAAYQAVPRFGEDLATLRQARRIRGLPGSWHPRLLVSLLVLAIRHGDRLALAMDARVRQRAADALPLELVRPDRRRARRRRRGGTGRRAAARLIERRDGLTLRDARTERDGPTAPEHNAHPRFSEPNRHRQETLK
jgi:hypothetical protein